MRIYQYFSCAFVSIFYTIATYSIAFIVMKVSLGIHLSSIPYIACIVTMFYVIVLLSLLVNENRIIRGIGNEQCSSRGSCK